MSDAIKNTKDLDASRTEALQGLLRSLGHTSSDPASGATLTTEQRQKLSEKIHEILGDDADREPTLGGQPSQPLNEDGLPIIDISEPVNGFPQMSTSPSSFPEQGLTPFTLLPPDERERRRRERDRILDLLEEEERLQQLQEERNAEEERREAIRKRKESAKAELDRLKAARELQKKMGQALVRPARGAENRRRENTRLKHQITSSPAKKSVSFVDVPVVKADERDQQTPIPQPDWGEVAPGKLRAQSHVPLASMAEAQKYQHPMKMRVVERHPTAPTSPLHGGADSDDESSSSAGHFASCMENNSSDEEGRASASNNDLSDDEPLEEGFDYDTAQHHREIALEYHKQRHVISAETARALAAHTLDGYERHETSDGQVPVSRFRANRMATAYDKSFGSISTSISQAVIPSSRQNSLRNSVRLGKLEDDQLVGGDSEESGSEDETIKEVVQMLKMGDIQNAGPDLKLSSTFTVAPQKSDAVESLSGGTSIAAHGAKPSRFKLAHRGIPETTTFQDNKSRDKPRSQLTVSSVVERKSPRSLSSQRFPIDQTPLRLPVQATPSMIIDSPSFPMITSTTIPSSSPRTTTTGSPSPHQMQFAHPPLVNSSAAQDPMIRPQVPTKDPSVQSPAQKFIVEREKMID